MWAYSDKSACIPGDNRKLASRMKGVKNARTRTAQSNVEFGMKAETDLVFVDLEPIHRSNRPFDLHRDVRIGGINGAYRDRRNLNDRPSLVELGQELAVDFHDLVLDLAQSSLNALDLRALVRIDEEDNHLT